ncbi:MAG: TrmB family transcriptional regulator [Candidatus Kariarchaeaceae archaeon]|jgi:sugar-specific transcriptional regulator TrmB
MPSTPEDTDEDSINFALSELGLNEYETRAYITILEGGVVVAREVSDRSSIPYAKVYQVLESLVGKQLIIGDEGRPRKFQSRDPRDALNDRLEAIEKNWKKRQDRRNQLVQKILPDLNSMFDNASPGVGEEQGVWTIAGITNILSRMMKLTTKTKMIIRISAGNPELVLTKLNKMLIEITPSIDIVIRSSTHLDELKQFGTAIAVNSIGDATSLIFDQFAQITIVETKQGSADEAEYTSILTQIGPIVESNIIDFSNSLEEGN